MSQNLGLIRYRKNLNRASHFALKWADIGHSRASCIFPRAYFSFNSTNRTDEMIVLCRVKSPAKERDPSQAREEVLIAAASANRCYPALVRASAPLTTSRSSLVIEAWRALLNFSVSSRISSDAFSVALSMAVIWAPCAAAFDSSSTRQS